MKKRMLGLTALALLLIALPVLAFADQFAVVKGGRLNLRQYPSATSASLGKYNTGTWVIVTGSAGNGFSSVKTLNGKSGYMSSSYLDFGAGANTGTVKYASGGYVNLRSGPSLSSSVVMRVNSGTTVTIVNDQNEWNYVSLVSGGQTVYGYMHNSFINRGQTSTAVVTTRNGGKVNVRSGPSSSYRSVGSLRSGTQVTVLLQGNGWYHISGGGLTGFMSTSYLSASGASSGTGSSGGVVTSSTAWVNNPKLSQVLNLRESPSQNARSIGQYRNGTQVKVVSYGNTWCEVYVGTRHGYMMTKYLSFRQPTMMDIGQVPPEPEYPTATPIPGLQEASPAEAPSAGTAGTLVAGTGSVMVNVYADAALTQLKGVYAPGQKVTILQYSVSSCMILIGGEVGYVATWNISF